MTDSTEHLSNRVENYIRYRPGYPVEVLQILREEMGFGPAWIVADIGSGTGISTKLFLDHGNLVYGVEPNREMREAAERLWAGRLNFHSIVGTAEETTLDEHSIDLAVAGQAFHWFDADRARREFMRILRPGGRVLLMWNTRHTGSTPFLRGYEALLQEFGTDYREVNHENIGEAHCGLFRLDAVPVSQAPQRAGV